MQQREGERKLVHMNMKEKETEKIKSGKKKNKKREGRKKEKIVCPLSFEKKIKFKFCNYK